MVKSGMIYLLDSSGGIVTANNYKSVEHRKKIIGTWEKMYAAQYYKCYLQLSPNVDNKINQDGTNSRKTKHLKELML